MLTKVICSYYDQSPWKMAATMHKGTIYFREFPSEAEEARRAAQTDREKRMCYWGIKFEDYMTAPSECGILCCFEALSVGSCAVLRH